MTQEKKQEFTLKISQANKTQLITILYEMVIEYLNDAIDEIGTGGLSDMPTQKREYTAVNALK